MQRKVYCCYVTIAGGGGLVEASLASFPMYWERFLEFKALVVIPDKGIVASS